MSGSRLTQDGHPIGVEVKHTPERNDARRGPPEEKEESVRLIRAWYASADAGVYRLTVADHGTSGSSAVRIASQARASHSTARTESNTRPLIEGAR